MGNKPKCRDKERRFSIAYSGKKATLMDWFVEFLSDINIISRNPINLKPLKQEFVRKALDHFYSHYKVLFRRWMQGEEIDVPTSPLELELAELEEEVKEEENSENNMDPGDEKISEDPKPIGVENDVPQ